MTVAYWYQTLPHKPFAALPDRAGRENRPPILPADIHRWREAWRQIQGGGALWGDEPLPKSFIRQLKSKSDSARARMVPERAKKAAAEETKKQSKMLNRKKKKKKGRKK